MAVTPKVGQQFTYVDRRWADAPTTTVVPTYVRESERPTSDGACLTADCTGRDIEPAGWYVEHAGGRTFVAFEDAR